MIVDELFTRYIVTVNILGGVTSVYCEECEQWVAEYNGDHLSTHSETELYEKIIDDHRDDFPQPVEFS